MYAMVVQVDVKPEHRDAYLAAISGHARRALANEPGTIRFDVIIDGKDPNRLYFYEAYVDKAAFDAHAKGESIAILRTEAEGMSDGTTIIGRGETVYPPNDDAAYWRT